MGWLRLDDGFYTHPKSLAAGRDGRDLYLAGLCYSNQQALDGLIPAHSLDLVAALAGVAQVEQTVTKLAEVGLWHLHDDGWMIHDFLEHQQSREQREAWKQKERDRKTRARSARTPDTKGDAPAVVRADTPRTPRGVRELSALENRTEQNRTEDSFVVPGGQSPTPNIDPPPTNPTTDDDERIDQALHHLGRADQTAAITAGTPIRNPTGHLAACTARRAVDRPAITKLAVEHPDWSADQLARHHLNPPPPPRRCGICREPAHPGGAADCPQIEIGANA